MSAVASASAVVDAVRQEYLNRTPRSRAAFETACEVVPGGISRSGIAFVPHPIVFERGYGCRAMDLDGNEYIDFLNNHASLVHGHAFPRITAAIQRQAERGTAWAAHHRDLAAVFVEPIMSFAGQILPEAGFLGFLREVTRQYNVLLVADEVVTLRLALGGAQEVFNFQPDLSLFGKIIGGGLPAGAVGGREDLLAVSCYRLGANEGLRLSLSGTFSGAAIVMAAGAAALAALDREAIARINALGNNMRARFQASCDAAGVTAKVTGLGSSLHVHFTPHEVRNYRDAATNNWAVTEALHLWLLTRGIYPSAQGWFNISTAMSEREVDTAVAAFSEGLTYLKPYIALVAPALARC